MHETILVTGSRGQVGSDLVPALRQRFSKSQIIESGRREIPSTENNGSLYEVLDVTDSKGLETIIKQYQVDTIYHLAGILSAKGEQNPQLCWQVNINGLRNILEAAKSYQLQVFYPSSIAVFGANTPKFKTPQVTLKNPSTIYGITKATGELLCEYYARQFGVDVRSLRFPGIISYNAPPGGGTTDFAVEIFSEAIKQGSYTCFVRPDTRLPMMYMPDAIRAILELMETEPTAITVRSSYNIAAISFSAAELVAEIQKHLPNFTCDYQPDFRQAIADSWPSVIDDTQARHDWGWQHSYDLPAIVADMLKHLFIMSSEFGVRSSEFGVRNSEFGIRSSEFGIRSSEYALRARCANGVKFTQHNIIIYLPLTFYQSTTHYLICLLPLLIFFNPLSTRFVTLVCIKRNGC